jgi:hypothetical protein
MIPVFLFEREVLCDGLHDKVGCSEGGLAAGGQHQLAQSVRHKRVPRLQKKMPKNVVFTGICPTNVSWPLTRVYSGWPRNKKTSTTYSYCVFSCS